MFLSAGPSALLLAVTVYLSTNVAPIPLLWVIPLALYLITFIIAFAAKPIFPARIATYLAVALIFPQQGPEKVRQLREYFLANKQQFGFPETYNYFLDPQKRYPLLEYYTPLMSGTGEIAVLQVGGDEKGEVVISNQAKLIKNVFQTWFDPGTSTSDRNYAEDPLYKDLLAEWLERKGNSYSHLFAFVNGPLALKALRNYVPTWAGEGSLFDPEKMRAERPAVFEYTALQLNANAGKR